MNADGSNLTRLVQNGADNFFPTWSPDGTKIAFTSEFHDDSLGMYVMNADGSNLTRLVGNGADNLFPTWSPDGTKIAYFSFQDDSAAIYVMNVDGANPTRLTEFVYVDFDLWTLPAWSPDSTKIAYASETNNNADIYVINADGTQRTRRTESSNIDIYPVWSPDGTKIAYMSIRDEENGDIEVITVRLPLVGDINNDGVVNIQDLVIVGANFGKTGQNDADVNGDGVVNIIDLVMVAGAFGQTAAAPALHSQAQAMLTAADVEGWLTQAQGLDRTDATVQRGLIVLEQLLAALTPKETALLPNYPNPFNPETWIPYHLAHAADVKLTIYSTKGAVVRRFELGYQPAGFYTTRAQAAYWDGRNASGESVASGVYFYQLRAGNYSALRRMVILK